MNNNTADDKIRISLEGLDTLKAGIVYGRDDAWDKLQARMEQQPRKKIALYYKVAAAAAAMLILAVGTCVWLLQPRQSGTPGISHHAAGNATPQGEKTVVKKDAAATPASILTASPANELHPQHMIITATPVTRHEEKENEAIVKVDSEPVLHAPAEMPQIAVAAPAKKMKIVHINELNSQPKDDGDITQNYQNPFPHVVFKMKVVHINELGQPVRQEEYMRNNQKNTVMRLRGQDKSDDGDIEHPRKLFRINLSQN